MEHVETLLPVVGTRRACMVFSLPSSTFYARRKAAARVRPKATIRSRRRSVRALSTEEQEQVIAIATSDEFIDKSPKQIVPTLLDRDVYLCSVRTMHRILGDHFCTAERRAMKRHSNHVKPELVATGPRQVFTWDITRLRGPRKSEYFNLYVVIDMFSRYVVGWLLAFREQDDLAKDLLEQTCSREGINANQLIVHADNGSSMRSTLVSELFENLHIKRSHSRPYTSNDNPYIESHFRTLKYAPGYPDRFRSIEEAHSFCTEFFDEYNHNMHHSGIAMLTPVSVHFGTAAAVIAKRQETLRKAYKAHPERFVMGIPKHKQVPSEVYINKPLVVSNEILIL